MAIVEYGTVAIVPKGGWFDVVPYDVGNLVEKDGSSYVAKKKPPVGTLPTDTTYWQVSAQGTSKATPTSLGTMKPDGATTVVDGNGAVSAKTATASAPGISKPDGTTISVDGNGTISAKKATTGTAGIVKPASSDFTVATDGTQKINTQFTQAVTLGNIIAGEAIASIWGKVAKSIATTMNLDQNALLKSMLTSQQVNDANKVPTSALVYAMQQAITANTNAVAQLNGDLKNFKAYFHFTDDENFNSNTNNWYESLPDSLNFILRLQVGGSIYLIEGYKADSHYGYMRRSSYSFPTIERRLNNGVWSAWKE